MKKLSAISFVILFTIFAVASDLCAAKSKNKVRLDLRSTSWLFDTSVPALSRIDAESNQTKFDGSSEITNSFTVRFDVDLTQFNTEKIILEIPKMLTVKLRQHDVKDRVRQNYPSFKMTDGSVPVLEASIALQSTIDKNSVRDMTIGVPLAMLPKAYGKHEVVLNFSGVSWTMYIDGELLDSDFAFGYPQRNDKLTWRLNADYVQRAEIFSPAIESVNAQKPKTVSNIQYWTPQWHNAWVGDVVTLFHKGRYHIFYLFDRREHASKFGTGGHYFEHISTADFKTWTEHEMATPITEQWETFGTGTPFIIDDKLCLSYGYHTSRIYPNEMTTSPAQWDYLNTAGHTGSFARDTTDGVPSGSSYSISADGISKFQKTGIMFHPCENPSIYISPQGRLRMLANYGARGTWESDSIDGGWRCLDANFPLGGDCTFFFRWGQYDYIIGGFDKLWSKPADAPETAYKDVVSQGLDFYNGMCVPSITEVADGRRVVAAWLKMRGWGGPLIIHEMIQFSDGRIGTKWLEEIVPTTGRSKTISSQLDETTTFLTPEKSFLLTFDVDPGEVKDGRFGVLFLPEVGDLNTCELQLDVHEKYAQFSSGLISGYSAREKSLSKGGSPHGGSNYAIDNLIAVDKPFTVRLIVDGSDKFGGSLIDAEIGGQRTMISFRSNLTVSQLRFRTDGVKIKNIKIAPLVIPSSGK